TLAATPTSMAEPTTPPRMPIICMIRSAANSPARYCMDRVAALIATNPSREFRRLLGFQVKLENHDDYNRGFWHDEYEVRQEMRQSPTLSPPKIGIGHTTSILRAPSILGRQATSEALARPKPLDDRHRWRPQTDPHQVSTTTYHIRSNQLR